VISRKRSAAAARILATYGIAALLLWGLERSQLAEAVNLLVYDLITNLRPAGSGRQQPVVIIGISEGDIKTYGWPIDDSLLCRAIGRLDAGGVRAIGLDLYRDKGVGPQQQCLRDAVRSNPRLVSIFNVAEAIEPIPGTPPTQRAYNDLVIKAAAAALRQHPKVNSSWLGDKIRYNDHIHIGMAVAVEEGLLVPVIRFADQLSLSQISTQAKSFGQKAKNKELQPKDWEGNTFTISNLGMFGIDEFTAIINPPDACILAVGGIKETVVVKDGQMVIGNIMKVTLSCDHRVVDGVVGSSFLQTLKGLLEDPVRMLV
jgi:hypothetical protein